MNKKIAIIIERADVTLGGAERSAFELRAALAARDIDVHILAAKGRTKTPNVHFLCRDMPGERTCYYTFAEAIQKHLSENQYDIVHSFLPFDFADIYHPRGGSFAEAVLRNAESYQNKFISFFKTETAFANSRRRRLLLSEKRLCKNPNGPLIIALSQYVAAQFQGHYGLADERVIVIPNGVKTDKQVNHAEAEKMRSHILAGLGLKEANNPVLFLFAANNFRLKGLSSLIKAIGLIETDIPAYLVVAGRDKVYKYQCLAKRLGVHKKVIFLGSIQGIQNALSVIDVAVLPTFYDPSSRFILEGLAANKPVITTRFNGAVDLFVDSRHGRVIDCPENISALAEAVNYFTNKDNIEKSSQAIIADNIEEKISINRTAEQIDLLYESILETRRRI